jgi:uncharacterized protein (DUF2336 family)
VGLTAQDISEMSRLALLAANPDGTRREDIYLAVASLYRSQAPMLSERERAIMREIMLRLTHDVEMAIRITLAEHLADDPTAPLDLILLLCDDKIEVARPIILRSRRLTDQDLLKFIADASTAHQTACAERPDIGEPLCDALARTDAEPVLIALVRNATARIAAQTFETLVEKSRQIASLQEPLVNRGDLPSTLATRMCEWVSEALKSHIAQSHPFAFESFAHSARTGPADRPERTERKPGLRRRRPQTDRQARRRRPAQGRIPAARAASGSDRALRTRLRQDARCRIRRHSPRAL